MVLCFKLVLGSIEEATEKEFETQLKLNKKQLENLDINLVEREAKVK